MRRGGSGGRGGSSGASHLRAFRDLATPRDAFFARDPFFAADASEGDFFDSHLSFLNGVEPADLAIARMMAEDYEGRSSSGGGEGTGVRGATSTSSSSSTNARRSAHTTTTTATSFSQSSSTSFSTSSSRNQRRYYSYEDEGAPNGTDDHDSHVPPAPSTDALLAAQLQKEEEEAIADAGRRRAGTTARGSDASETAHTDLRRRGGANSSATRRMLGRGDSGTGVGSFAGFDAFHGGRSGSSDRPASAGGFGGGTSRFPRFPYQQQPSQRSQSYTNVDVDSQTPVQRLMNRLRANGDAGSPSHEMLLRMMELQTIGGLDADELPFFYDLMQQDDNRHDGFFGPDFDDPDAADFPFNLRHEHFSADSEFGDGATYESLLALSEELGPAVATGGTEIEIDAIRRRILTHGDISKNRTDGPPRCPICLDDFVSGATVMELKCGHFLHTDCGVPWLERSRKCPTCREDFV